MPFRLGLIIIIVTLFLSGCSEPVKPEQLHGYWLHNFEREGIDFSPEGVVAHYRLSPQKIELYTFELRSGQLLLDDISTKKDEETELSFTVDGPHFQTHSESGTYQNYSKYSLPEAPTLMPEIVGLWKTETKGSKEFWNFTEWGTVYAWVELTPGRYEALWAKFQLKRSSGLLRDKSRRMVLWGAQGENPLSGEVKKVDFKGGKLVIEGHSFVRLTSADSLLE